jgi:NADH-quinone oxidoreductase subunit C
MNMEQYYENIFTVVKINTDKYEIYNHRNQVSITIPKENLLDICYELKENSEIALDFLVDVTAIDWLDKKHNRFEVVYFLYSMKFKKRLRLKVQISEHDLHCPSVVDVWESANWYERETFDMYGLKFDGHPNLRRFYMPEDYVDPESGEPIYPLRKDFPLMGIPDSLPLPPYPEKFGEVL